MPPRVDTTVKRYANEKIQEQFPKDVQPLAQLIMLDAAHGDSNIIDFCVKDLKEDGSYATDSWQRYLIDSGIAWAQIRLNVKRAIVSYKLPRSPEGHQPLPDGEHTRVHTVQFTHTDEDHSGGGQRLLQALATEETIQRHFDETILSFHRLPAQDPGWMLRLATSGNYSLEPEYKVFCHPSNWGNVPDGLRDGRFDIFFTYAFYVDGKHVVNEVNKEKTVNDPPFAVSANSLLITDADLQETITNQLTVKCVVTISQRRKVGKTMQMVEFPLRVSHKNMFEVTTTYNVQVKCTGRRCLLVGLLPQQLHGNGTVGETTEPVKQPYHGIEEALANVRLEEQRIKRTLINKIISSPTEGAELYCGADAAVTIVGPTTTIYNQFMGDCLRHEYEAGGTKSTKDSELHNMASIVTLFRRFPPTASAASPALLSMLYTGDAHDRECQLRDTVLSFAGPIKPRHVDVLKIPHHGSRSSSSVEFYKRITATVYLVCARQNMHGLPNLEILEAIVDQTIIRDDGPMVHIFFSNPDSLWNIAKPKEKGVKVNPDKIGQPSNVKQLLTGSRRPGLQGRTGRRYNYTCYILKHRVEGDALWSYLTDSPSKNAGIILLGRKDGMLDVTASKAYWDIWDAKRGANDLDKLYISARGGDDDDDQ